MTTRNKATDSGSSTPNSTETTKSAAKGALYSFLLRILSFVLTQITIRCVDPVTLGQASIRLELLCSTTVLFLSREGFRLGLLRSPNDAVEEQGAETNKRKIQVNNVAWLCVPLGVCMTLIAFAVHLITLQQHTKGQSKQEVWDYKMAGILYCFATIIEICSEPFMIVSLRSLDVTTRAKAEGIASIGKALTSVVLLSILQHRSSANSLLAKDELFIKIILGPISSFGFSQCVYAAILTTILFKKKWKLLSPPTLLHRGKISANLDNSTLRLAALFSFQSIFKHILTEGDRIVLSTLAGSYDSGLYAMVISYGSMASRLLFQPIEENGRYLFSNFHASILHAKQIRNTKENSKKMPHHDLVRQLHRTYCVLVKLVIFIGLIFASLGSNYTSVLLRLLAGKSWATMAAADTLSAFCMYTAIMSLNGMTEAFVYGVAQSNTDVGSLAVAHGVVGLIFYVVAPLLVLHHGSVGGTIGLILTNGLCMALRSLYSLDFAAKYFYIEVLNEEKRIDGDTDNKEVQKTRSFVSTLTSYTNSLHQRLTSLRKLFIEILPRPQVISSFLISYKVTDLSKHHFVEKVDESLVLMSCDTGLHVAIGITCAFTIFCMIYRYEKEFLSSLKTMVTSSKAKVE